MVRASASRLGPAGFRQLGCVREEGRLVWSEEGADRDGRCGVRLPRVDAWQVDEVLHQSVTPRDGPESDGGWIERQDSLPARPLSDDHLSLSSSLTSTRQEVMALQQQNSALRRWEEQEISQVQPAAARAQRSARQGVRACGWKRCGEGTAHMLPRAATCCGGYGEVLRRVPPRTHLGRGTAAAIAPAPVAAAPPKHARASDSCLARLSVPGAVVRGCARRPAQVRFARLSAETLDSHQRDQLLRAARMIHTQNEEMQQLRTEIHGLRTLQAQPPDQGA